MLPSLDDNFDETFIGSPRNDVDEARFSRVAENRRNSLNVEPIQAPFRRSFGTNTNVRFSDSMLTRRMRRVDVANSSGPNPDNMISKRDFEETLKCGICFEIYGTRRLPKNLECGHCFCATCLQTLRKDSSLDCPNCRHKTMVTRPCLLTGTELVLPTNYTVLAVVENLEKVDAGVRDSNSKACFGCKTKTERLWECKTCEQQNIEKIDAVYCAECILEFHENHTKERLDFALIEAKKSSKRRIGQMLQEEFRAFQATLATAIDDLQEVMVENRQERNNNSAVKNEKCFSFLNKLDKAKNIEECLQAEESLKTRQAILDLVADLLA